MMYVLALCVGIPASRLAVEHAFFFSMLRTGASFKRNEIESII